MNKSIMGLVTALTLTPTLLPAATRQQAQRYIQEHDYVRAVPELRALMQSPGNRRDGDLNKWFGQALCMTGAYAESVPYLEAGAKAGKMGAWWYLGIAQQHLYDYDAAIASLETYRSKCSETSGWIERTDSIIAECRLGQRAVQHVEDVVIVDSLQVPARYFWQHYLPGAESGRLVGMQDTVAYENQPGDYRLWAGRDEENGVNTLWEAHAFGGEWETPKAIASVSSEQFQIAYPWQRTDGETLYFACDSTPGLGGLDIYMTTYDADQEAYRAPQRLGMPFNSPYNDYMLAIDEMHQVGWWATDRQAEPGMVTIYLFLLEEMPEYLEGYQPERARITSIAETWREEQGYADLVNTLRTAPQVAEVVETVRIPIDDHTVLTAVEQFRSEEARTLYQQAKSLHDELQSLKERLEELRMKYHAAAAADRKEMEREILGLERRLQELRTQTQKAERTYRQKEIAARRG